METKVLTTEEIIKALREQVVDYRQEIVALKSVRLDLDETIQQDEATISNLKGMVDGHEETIDSLNQNIQELTDRIERVENLYKFRGKQIDDLEDGISARDEKITLIESESDMARELYTLREGIKNRDEKIESQATKIAELKNLIAETNNKLVGLHRLFEKIEEV